MNPLYTHMEVSRDLCGVGLYLKAIKISRTTDLYHDLYHDRKYSYGTCTGFHTCHFKFILMGTCTFITWQNWFVK